MRSVGWRAFVVAWLVWLILFTVAEGTGRQVCRMPTRRWIEAATDVRDRTMRQGFRDSAGLCLDATPWYRYSMGALMIAGFLAPFVVVWLLRSRVRRLEVLTGAAFTVTILLMLVTIGGVRWLYDWYA